MCDPSQRKGQRANGTNKEAPNPTVGYTSEPVGSWRAAPPGASNGSLAEAARNERINAYKEQRRKQLQSKGLEKADSFSSSSEAASVRRSLRFKDRPSQGASGNLSSTSSASGVRRFITRDQGAAASQTLTSAEASDLTVRSTKASRLRAQMNITSKPGEDMSHEENVRKGSLDGSQIRVTSLNHSGTDHNENFTKAPAMRVPPVQGADSLLSSTTTESDNSSETGARVKDKSGKRKSNLNRASVIEEPIRAPSNNPSLERRFRRPSHGKESSNTSESDKIEAVSRRLSTSEIHKKSSSDSLSDSKSASNPLLVQRKPSLERHLDVKPKSRVTTPRKQAALKRPEIPDVLKRTASPTVRSSSPTVRASPPKEPLNVITSTPKKISSDSTVEIEESRCDFSFLQDASSLCLSSDRHSDDSFHSVSQALDTELDESFGTPPETLRPSVQENPVVYTLSISTKGASFPYDKDIDVVEAVNYTPFTTILEGIELSSHPKKELAEQYQPPFSSSAVEPGPIPILKCKNSEEDRKEDIQGILKVRTKDDAHEEPPRKPPSILKKRDSCEEKEFESTLLNPIFRQFAEEGFGSGHSILKTKSLDEHSSQPKPILKRGSLSEDQNSQSAFNRSLEVPRPILKKKTFEEDSVSEEKPRPILKTRLSHEDMTENFESDSGILRSILRKPPIDKNKCPKKPVRRNSDVSSDSSAFLFRASSVSPPWKDDLPTLPTPDKSSEEQVPLVSEVKCEAVSVKDSSVISKLDLSSLVAPTRKGGGLRVADGVMPSSRERFDRRNTPRYRTQPITQVEVQETDSLESVQAFRTLITTQASLHMFEEECEEEPKESATSKREYPQRYRPDRRKDRRTNCRYRTLPITLERPLEESSPCVNRNEVSVSSPGEETKGLTVLAKASLFQKKALEASVGAGRRSSEVRNRFLMRHSHPRSQTQPITEEEVHEAAKIVDGIKKAKEEEEKKEAAAKLDEDDPAKLSLVEKMRLFNQKMQEELKPKAPLAKGPKRRRSDGRSRFQTQPITTEEVRKANRHSFGGLAASLQPPEDDEDGKENISGSTSNIWRPTLPAEDEIHKSPSTDDHQRALAVMVAKMAAARSRTTSEPKSERKDPKLSSDVVSGDQKVNKKPDTGKTDTLGGKLSGKELVSERTVNVKDKSKEVKSDTTLTTPVKDSKSALDKKNKRVDKSEESSSSSSESEDDGKDDTKKVLSAGQSHLVIYSPGQVPLPASVKKGITNPAVQRRINATLRKKEEKRLQQELSEAKVSQLPSLMQETPDPLRERDHTAGLPIRRSQTEHMAPKAEPSPVIEGGSIKERLAALQRSGTEDWQKRLFQSPEKRQTSPKTPRKDETLASKETPPEDDDGTMAIASRLSKLQRSSEQWRHRVEEKDAAQFTVAGKMGVVNGSSAVSPSLERKAKKIPLPFKSPLSAIEKGEEEKKELFRLGLAKSKSMPIALANLKNEVPSADDDDEKGCQVLVPKADDETFSSFFDVPAFFKSQSQVLSNDLPDLSSESLDLISAHSQTLTVQHRKVQVQRRHHAARNPIRALASRTDLQKQEYVEQSNTVVAQKVIQRMQVAQLAQTSDKSLSALAGLVSTEDFKNVSLRKGGDVSSALLPTHNLMLVQVKGRRHIQTRLMEPRLSSLNQGDSYVLVTPNKVICWMGPFTNVIERAKVCEVASIVQLKKDLCFRGSSALVTIDLEKEASLAPEGKERSPVCTAKDKKEFYGLLGGDEVDEGSVPSAGTPEEDELYESAIIGTNMVYILEGDSLVPNKEFWGHLPKVEALKPDKVVVLDFGSEMYVWKGKQSPQEERTLGVKLAKELWSKGYDYTECLINPICPQTKLLSPGSSKTDQPGRTPSTDSKGELKSSVRPDWCIFAPINQHMEPVLFREKFLDWPDTSRLIKVKGQDDEADSAAKATEELRPCDVDEMLNRVCPEPDLILEGQNIGRGVEWQDPNERHIYEITSLEVTVWHVLEYESRQLPYANGQLHSGDTYVVRWRYMVTKKGRSLHGDLSRHSFTGRNRCAYFFWQGLKSSITEKGASALMTVELNEERGPHVRVNQGKEPPCFLNLFEGRMIIYRGEREDETTNTAGPWKLFIVRGQFQSEAFLLEVRPEYDSLRSRASFLLVNCTTGLIHIWHGKMNSREGREVAVQAANNIVEVQPEEMVFENGAILKTVEVFEGQEPAVFLDALFATPADDIRANGKDTAVEVGSPRLFYLSSVSGTFLANEMLCSFRSSTHPCLLPFLQEDLYLQSQPALFLLEPPSGDCLYLWQGWWPEGDEETTNVATGSATIRWNTDRRCAMQTALDYAKAKKPVSSTKVLLVSAGLEPVTFTHLFPEWNCDENITLCNLQDGKLRVGECLDVTDVLKKLSRTHYTLEELQALPEGVDPLNLEKYLDQQDFENVMKMNKEEFYSLPKWKQTKLKKQVQLF